MCVCVGEWRLWEGGGHTKPIGGHTGRKLALKGHIYVFPGVR